MRLNPIEAIRASFRLRLAFSIGVVLFVVLSLYLLFFVDQITRTLRQSLIEQGQSAARDLGFASELGVLAGDPSLVDASVVGISEQTDVMFVAVYNREGNVIVSRGNLYPPAKLSLGLMDQLAKSKEVFWKDVIIGGKSYYQFYGPIAIQTLGISGVGEIVGFTEVALATDKIYEQQSHILLAYFLISLLIFFVAGGFLIYLTKRITSSVDALIAGVRSITAGKFDEYIDIKSLDEFGRLATAFNQMTKTLQETNERDKALSRMKSEFLSITAHQLRTPLSALKWVLGMTLEGDMGPLKSKQKDLLEKGYSANERMIALVNDLLNIVRIEEGKFNYNLEDGNIAVVIESLVKELKTIADQKAVELVFQNSSRNLPNVFIDQVKLRLAITNIIDNAVQYTPKGGRIDIELTLTNNEIFVLVKDTGIGIPKDQMGRLFTKFFRADNAVKMQASGSGLGLFIAKNIIEKHGGKIWIESEQNKGTTVYFTIPIPYTVG